MRNTTQIALTVAATLLVCAGASIAAADMTVAAAGNLISLDDDSLRIQTEEGETSFSFDDDALWPDDLEPGEPVIVHHIDGSASEILRVDAEVEVTDDLMDGDNPNRRAVLGTVESTSPDQVIVNTTSGDQAFVILSEKLFPPVPTPGDKVAVIYRLQGTTFEGAQAKGEELVLLPAGTMISEDRVKISYSQPATETEVEAELEAEAEAAMMAEVEPEPQPMRSPAELENELDTEPYEPSWEASRLPQTASPFTLIGLAGLSLVGGGLALRRRS